MKHSTMMLASLGVLSAAGLVAWAWLVMARVERDMREFSGFEEMHFEIGPRAVPGPEGAKWPIPG